MSDLTNLQKTRMRAMRNGVYHSMRRQFFERAERLCNLLTIILGTASVLSIASNSIGGENAAILIGFLVAISGAIQLVFNLSGRAREHATLQERFYNLLARAETLTDEPDLLVQNIEAEMSSLYGKEPPTYHVINAIAYNAVQNAFGRQENGALFKIDGWKSLLGNVFHYSPEDLNTCDELSGVPPAVRGPMPLDA